MNLHDEKWLEHQIKIYEKALEIVIRNKNAEKRVEYESELERLKGLR